LKARVVQLSKTEAEWQKLDTFKPEAGELIIYSPDDDYDYARLKIGDGKHTIKDLAFALESAVNDILATNGRAEVIDAGRVTSYIK
jgi:hypothetical protein